MHCYTKVMKHKFKSSDQETLPKSILIKLKPRTKRYCSLFSCTRVMCLYKSQTHVANYCKFKLSTDIKRTLALSQCMLIPAKQQRHIAKVVSWYLDKMRVNNVLQ